MQFSKKLRDVNSIQIWIFSLWLCLHLHYVLKYIRIRLFLLIWWLWLSASSRFCYGLPASVSCLFRLVFSRTQHHVTAEVFSSSSPVPVLTCSTKEWAVKKELASTNCVAACQAVGDVLAHRCHQAGITRMVYKAIPWTYRSDAVSTQATNCCLRNNLYVIFFLKSSPASCVSISQVQSFRAAMKNGGITLSEPRRKYVGTWI